MMHAGTEIHRDEAHLSGATRGVRYLRAAPVPDSRPVPPEM